MQTRQGVELMQTRRGGTHADNTVAVCIDYS